MGLMPAIYTYKHKPNRYTPAGEHGDITVYRLKHLTAEEIEKHGLKKYVNSEVEECTEK